MTLPRYYEISKFWENYPPIHLSVLAGLGHKPKSQETAKREAQKSDPRQMDELMSMFGATPGFTIADKPPVKLN